jgi:hypothetical protein
MKTILIDDVRSIDADVICRTFDAGISALKTLGPFGILYLDHDLGELSFDGGEAFTEVDGHRYPKNGYGVVCFLENNREFLPIEIRIVSSNPVGRRNMQVVIDKLYKENV